MRGLRYAVAGVLAAGMAVVVQAQPGFGFGAGGPSGLVSNKAVQEDLKLSEEQVTKVKTWAEEFRKTAQKIREDKGVKGGGFGGKVDAEMLEKMAAANAEISKAAYKELGEVLKKEQVDRLRQIERQQMGIRAFTDADTATALKLTDMQKASAKGIGGDFQKESREMMSDLFKGGKGGFDQEKIKEMQTKTQKLQKEYMDKIVELLDADQKKTWKQLTGEAFDLSKLQQGFGPPRKKD
ncbi:MAG: hypothetical protein C0501_10985 [Isosphaera sp.]|nr:hypothetical protein [Isosphaera sp.]